MMKFSFKKIAVVSGLSLAALAAVSSDASAQGNRRYDDRQDRKIEKQREKIERQQERLREQRQKLARERREDRYNNNGYNNNGYYNNGAYNNNNRYRVYRNGSYYNTDNRGAELLRQAVNSGYQQGYQAGQYDRNNRRRSTWTTSDVYRSGTYGYQSYVDRSQYQYYFQQGFQRGYQDGFNSQTRYGYNNGNGLNILGNILSSILNIQQY